MALHEIEQATKAVDGVEELRRNFDMTRERHSHVRATLWRRLKEVIERMEVECKEMGQDLDLLNAMYPDIQEGPSTAVDYGAEAPGRGRR